MFLHRLGRAYGIYDIDALDNSISDKQLVEHQAVAWIDGWHHGRTPTAEVVAEIRNLGNVIISAQSSDPKQVASELTWHSASSIIEQLTSTKPLERKSKTMIPVDQAAAELERRYG